MVTIQQKHAYMALRGWTPAVANPFVGTWKLVSCNAHRRNGQVMPLYGPEPEGRLFYDGAGNMSVHIMQAGRPKFNATRAAERNQQLEQVGARLRAMMPFLDAVEVTADGEVKKASDKAVGAVR